MSKSVPVCYTDRALRNAHSIQKYLKENFSDKQVEKFYKLLKDFEKSVSQLPELYPVSIKQSDLRKAVLNKHLSVIYIFRNETVFVIAMQDNRQANPGL